MKLKTGSQPAIKNKIKVYKYKDKILEYRPKLGWVLFKKGEKVCKVYYTDTKEHAIEAIKKDETYRKSKNR